MKKKSIFLKTILICLMIALGYIQAIQLVHSPHAAKSSTETTQYNTSEFSCYICDVIQHAQTLHYCSFSNTASLAYHPHGTDLCIYTAQEHPLRLAKQDKNKSPPLP